MPDIPGPYEPEEMRRFLDTFLYKPEAFLIDAIDVIDEQSKTIEARMETTRDLPIASLQRADPDRHPAHVSGSEMLMLTGSLGCLHAWFFYGCRWDEGWAGFGNRIHRADFKTLATIGPPLRLQSRETKSRVGPKRIVIRYSFDFWQGDAHVYRGDQSAIFVKRMKA